MTQIITKTAVKRLTSPFLSKMLDLIMLEPKLRKLGKSITKKDIANAIKWARRKAK